MLILLNKILWMFTTLLIILTGVYFTIKLKGLQFNIVKIIKSFLKKEETNGIKSSETLMMVLAGRIGVGSIAGVALAIYFGGPGSIFWMWIISFIGAINCFCETYLGIKYKEKDELNIYKGGPSYYIKNGLGSYKLGALYALLVLFSYLGGFLCIQSNTITKSINQVISISPLLIGLLIIILILPIIFGGIKKISDVTCKIVPFMTIGYVFISIIICLKNYDLIPNVFSNIVSSAFDLRPFLGGFMSTLIIGIQRGIFSNEAGIGTGAIASSIVETNDNEKEGLIQMVGVYITSLIICTSTALIILTSPYNMLNISDINGIEITQYAFNYHLGYLGNYIIFLSIILFSFTTILTGYYNGESCLKYFFKEIPRKFLNILKIITLLILFLGCILSSEKIWLFVDILVSIEALINLISIILLRKNINI